MVFVLTVPGEIANVANLLGKLGCHFGSHPRLKPAKRGPECRLEKVPVLPSVDLYQYEPWEPPITEEELRRREQETESYTTAEVLSSLQKEQTG